MSEVLLLVNPGVDIAFEKAKVEVVQFLIRIIVNFGIVLIQIRKVGVPEE